MTKYNKYRKILIVISILLCFIVFCGFNENDNKVFDDASLLEGNQEQYLQEQIKQLSKKYETDIAIVTTNDTFGKNSGEYAQSFYMENNMGYEDTREVDKSGIVYLIDMYNREVYVATSGKARLLLTDGDVDKLTDNAVTYLKEGDYFEACNHFLLLFSDYASKNVDKNKEYIEKWEDYEGNYNSFYEEYLEEGFFAFLKNPIYCILIALIIGVVAVALMAYNNKSKMTANGNTYMDKSQFIFHNRTDNYIRTTTIKRKIENSSSSGGGGGGQSFGGGGKSF